MNERWPNFAVVIPTIGHKKEILKVIEFLNANYIKYLLVEQKSLELKSILDGYWGLNELNHVKTFGEFGASRARNVGLNLLDTNVQYVMFINDSAIPNLNFIKQSLHYMNRHKKIGAIVGNYKFSHNGLKIDHGNRKSIFVNRFIQWDYFNALESAVIWKVEYIKSVKGFAEDIGVGSGTPIGSMEATDLLFRIAATGAIVTGTKLVAGFDQRLFPKHNFITDMKYGIGFSYVARRYGYFSSALYRVPTPIVKYLLRAENADSPNSFLGNIAVVFGRLIGLFISDKFASDRR